MKIPRPWTKIAGLLISRRGRSERDTFSLGERPAQSGQKPQDRAGRTPWSKDLDANVRRLKEIFHVPDSSDVVIREVSCAKPNLRVVVAFIEGLASADKVTASVLKPLMLLSPIRQGKHADPVAQIKDALLTSTQVEVKHTVEQCVEAMVSGDTIVLIQGQDTALAVETKGWEHRSVQEAVTERIVRGPQQGFVEVLRANTALLRSMVRSPDLVIENIEVGRRTRTQCAIVYMAGIANDKLVHEVRRRITSIDIDAVLSSGSLEQLIETSHGLLPTMISTERPDRVAHFVLEGAVAILVAGDPFAIIAPVTFSAFLHSPEDYYVRWPYGNILRLIRVIALLIAVLLPGTYIAITNYHQEMIPTVLLFSIAASRETVPLPLPLEVLLMYFGFDLIREAGIRIPSPFGPTIGIVGALLIGEAAVSASLVSPIMVIVIAITGVASFTIPNLEVGMLIRVATLVFILAGSFLGLFGIVATLYVTFCKMASLTSLGVPFLAPMAPKQRSGADVFTMGPVWASETRPRFLRPKDLYKQPEIARQWAIEPQRPQEGNPP